MHAEARQRQHRDSATTQCALFVLSVLLLVLGILLGCALSPLHPLSVHSLTTVHAVRNDKTPRPAPDSRSDQSLNEAESKAHYAFSTSGVPYHPATVAAQALKVGSRSLTGRPCEQQGCISQGDGAVVNLLVTTDNRLVMANEELGSILVYSETGVDTIHVQHKPFGLAQLPDQMLAVTCRDDNVILILDIDGENRVVQNVSTHKQYASVAPGPSKETLLVASPTNFTIDVITMQGHVIRTLIDSARVHDVHFTLYLKIHEGDVISCAGSKELAMSTLIRFRLSDSDEVDQVDTETLIFPVFAVSVDRAGNMFTNQVLGQVVLKTRDGEYRHLLHSPKPDKYIGTGIVVHDDRLVVAWHSSDGNHFLLMEYKLFDE